MLVSVRASTRVLSVVCVMKKVVVVNRDVLFNSAYYNMIINITRAGSLTISSAGVTVCSLVLICQAGLVSAGGCLGCTVSSPL